MPPYRILADRTVEMDTLAELMEWLALSDQRARPGTMRIIWEGDSHCSCGAIGGSAHDHFGAVVERG